MCVLTDLHDPSVSINLTGWEQNALLIATTYISQTTHCYSSTTTVTQDGYETFYFLIDGMAVHWRWTISTAIHLRKRGHYLRPAGEECWYPANVTAMIPYVWYSSGEVHYPQCSATMFLMRYAWSARGDISLNQEGFVREAGDGLQVCAPRVGQGLNVNTHYRTQ